MGLRTMLTKMLHVFFGWGGLGNLRIKPAGVTLSLVTKGAKRSVSVFIMFRSSYVHLCLGRSLKTFFTK